MVLKATVDQMNAIATDSGHDHSELLSEIAALEGARDVFVSSFKGQAGSAAVTGLAQTIDAAKSTAKDLEGIIDTLQEFGYKIAAADQAGLDDVRSHGGVEHLQASKVDLSAINALSAS
ncbi:WXG100 family type VII secretion target [Nocardia sp. NPDC046763]|uniref:WXG100 family type VII secretion target n=1 Tax=Nocardia sp. NPDC046763 TaxID=3155256 RepID=UPI0033FE846E